MSSPASASGKESTCNAGNSGLIPGSGRSLGGGLDNPLQYSFLENPMDRGDWWSVVHRVTKSWTRLKRLGTQTLTPRKGPAVNTAEINCKHSQLSRSQWRKVKFPHSLKNKNPKLPQDNMLCIPNITGEMPIKMTTRNQTPTDKMPILTICKH